VVGDETNAVVLQRTQSSEISIVRDGIQYTITHFHDPASVKAIECLRRTARFPSAENAQAAIRSWTEPGNRAIAAMLQGKIPPPATAPSIQARGRGQLLGRLADLVRKIGGYSAWSAKSPKP